MWQTPLETLLVHYLTYLHLTPALASVSYNQHLTEKQRYRWLIRQVDRQTDREADPMKDHMQKQVLNVLVLSALVQG